MNKLCKLTCLITLVASQICYIGINNAYAEMAVKNIENDKFVLEIPSVKDELVILWTSGDKEVAKRMVFMYAYNSKNFNLWKYITIIVWGPSQKLLIEDEELQQYAKKMMNVGIKFKACLACADEYKAIEKLKNIGVDVKFMSQELSLYIDRGNRILTF